MVRCKHASRVQLYGMECMDKWLKSNTTMSMWIVRTLRYTAVSSLFFLGHEMALFDENLARNTEGQTTRHKEDIYFIGLVADVG